MSENRACRTCSDVVLADDNDDHAVLIRMVLERTSKIPEGIMGYV
jgi:hypothetical protein